MNLEATLHEALALAAAAKPDTSAWSGPASAALSLRVDLLVDELTVLVGQASLLPWALSPPFTWSSASLIN